MGNRYLSKSLILFLIFTIGVAAFHDALGWIVSLGLIVAFAAWRTFGLFSRGRGDKAAAKLSGKEKVIAERIEQHLQTHDDIRVDENLSLKPTIEGRRMFDRLGVYLDGGFVCLLSEFKAFDDPSYQNFLDALKWTESLPAQEEPKLTADSFIEKINEYNTDITHDEISNYLYLTSSLLTSISTLEKKGITDPQKTRKLYLYYLPILLDILENYCNMKDNVYVALETKVMEEKLIKTIILCNEALKTLLAALNESDLMHMSANMNALESILKSDGLIREGTLYGKETEKVKEVVK